MDGPDSDNVRTFLTNSDNLVWFLSQLLPVLSKMMHASYSAL